MTIKVDMHYDQTNGPTMVVTEQQARVALDGSGRIEEWAPTTTHSISAGGKHTFYIHHGQRLLISEPKV